MNADDRPFEPGKYYRLRNGTLVKFLGYDKEHKGSLRPVVCLRFRSEREPYTDHWNSHCGWYATTKDEFPNSNIVPIEVMPTAWEIEKFSLEITSMDTEQRRKAILKAIELCSTKYAAASSAFANALADLLVSNSLDQESQNDRRLPV